jgi:succinoglycan biosynthesis protein ExoA
MSSDATREVVNRYAQADYPVRLLDNPRMWASAGRNVGVHHARGDIIVIVDGHCELRDRRYLNHLVGVFERTGADVVGRPQPLTPSRNSALQQAIALARSSPLGHHPDSYIYSAEDQFVPAQSVGAAYLRTVFEKLGDFDESFDACEDVEFNYRADQAGLPCYLSTQATVHYHPRGNLGGLFYQLARYGRGRVRLYRKHSETFTFKSMAPGFFLIGLLFGGVLACCHSLLLTAYLLFVSFYFLTLFLFSIRIAWQSGGWTLLPWLPLVFLAIHLGAGWGILQEWLWGNRHST